MSPMPTRDALLEELPYAKLQVTGRTALIGSDEGEPGVRDWQAKAVLFVSERKQEWLLQEELSLGKFNPQTEEITIFEASGLTIDPWRVNSPWEALDSRSADYAHFVRLFNGEGELVPELDDQLDAFGSDIVILDRARLAPGWRGIGGAGRLLLAELLDWLSSGARLIALHPFPIDLTPEQRQDDKALARALDQVKRTWSSLGFEPFNDDIWIRDTSSVSCEEALTRFRQELLSR